MRLTLQLIYFLLAICASLPAHAEEGIRQGPAGALLARLDRHGFADPMDEARKIGALMKARQLRPAELLRLHAAQTGLYIAADRKREVEAGLAWLARAAAEAGCVPCGQWSDLRRIQWIVRRHDVARLLSEWTRIRALASATDPFIRQQGLYLAAAASDAQATTAAASNTA